MRTAHASALAMVSCVFAIGSCDPAQFAGKTIVGTTNYAAMDEVPVGGGELRLVAPIRSVDDHGAHRQAIGFPLEHTAVIAHVGGMMATYEIEQTFANPYDEPIEAVYVFPLGDKGAVSGYQIGIGDRTITGAIQTREQARRTYEQAKSAGHTAALVEQNKPNVFSQYIANIAPHERIRVKLTYVDLLAYDNGSYEMVVPLVVGPRYLPEDRTGRTPVSSRHAGSPGRPGTTSVPYIDPEQATSNVSFLAEIDAGVPIQAITSPSHELAVTTVSPTRSRVVFGHPDEIPNRDLIVRYTTAGPQTQVGVLAHRTGDDGYFVLAIQPKAQYRTGDIAPREVMLVIDRSGSMSGEPIAQAKAVASVILDTLTERDAFDIIGFASGVDAMSPGLVRGDAAGKQRGHDYLDAMTPGGGTQMEGGVNAMLTADAHERVRLIYFLTDGFVGNDDVVIAAARTQLGANRILPIGVGSAPNRYLLDRLGVVGRGFASYVTASEPPDVVGRELVLRSAQPYLTDVTIDWGGLRVDRLNPAIIPDVYAGQPLVVTGTYRAPGTATVRITATTAGRRITIPVEVALPARHDLEPVASLWARREIEALMMDVDPHLGMSGDTREAVTQLGLQFHLLTELTSFVAVDRTRVVSNGQVKLVEQPAIVPEGVDGRAAVADEPPAPQRHHRSHYDGNSGGLFSGGAEHGPGARVAAFTILLLICLVLRRRSPRRRPR